MNFRVKGLLGKKKKSIFHSRTIEFKKKEEKEKRKRTPKFNKIQFLVFKISSPIKKKTETFPHLYYLYNKSIHTCMKKYKVFYVYNIHIHIY